MLSVEVSYLSLLLLLTFDGGESVTESLNERSYQSFYPFGNDAYDSTLYARGDRCSLTSHGPGIFTNYGVYVSL